MRPVIMVVLKTRTGCSSRAAQRETSRTRCSDPTPAPCPCPRPHPHPRPHLHSYPQPHAYPHPHHTHTTPTPHPHHTHTTPTPHHTHIPMAGVGREWLQVDYRKMQSVLLCRKGRRRTTYRRKTELYTSCSTQRQGSKRRFKADAIATILPGVL